MTQQENAPSKAKKARHGARGIRKVKTGCLTCKIRRKKCDEGRPACSTCINAGWPCDFVSTPPIDSPAEHRGVAPLIRSLPYTYARPLLEDERGHMEYFQVVCAREISIYFEISEWENVILQATAAEPTLHHAALAIGCLTSSRYHPTMRNAHSSVSFSIRQYGLAIRALRKRLDRSVQSLELAVLASVLFALIEFLLELDSQVQVHFQAGVAMLENLHGIETRLNSPSGQGKLSCLVEQIPISYDLLADAISQIISQVNSFIAYQAAHRQRGQQP